MPGVRCHTEHLFAEHLGGQFPRQLPLCRLPIQITGSPDQGTARLIIWLLHNLVEASSDLFRYLLLGDQLEPKELHPLVSYTSCMNLNLL